MPEEVFMVELPDVFWRLIKPLISGHFYDGRITDLWPDPWVDHQSLVDRVGMTRTVQAGLGQPTACGWGVASRETAECLACEQPDPSVCG